MTNTKDIKKRIKSIKSIEKITAAMKMVATSRLRQFQGYAEKTRPYAEKLQEIMFNISSNAADINNPLFAVRKENISLYIVIGAEGGLAGSYNVNVMNRAMKSINNRKNELIKLLPIGKKAVDFFNKKPYEIVTSLSEFGTSPSYASVKNIVQIVKAMFENQEIDALYLVYAKFKSAMSQEPVVNKILPMEPMGKNIIDVSKHYVDMIFEPSPETIMKELVPEYLNTLIYHAVMEAMASEYGARMTAMTSANRNAEELLDELSLAYNKARQAIITNELIDILNGVNAVK